LIKAGYAGEVIVQPVILLLEQIESVRGARIQFCV